MLKVLDHIKIGNYTGIVRTAHNNYYFVWRDNNGNNSLSSVRKELGIYHIGKFTKNFLVKLDPTINYTSFDYNDCPEVKTLDDLEKYVKLLNKILSNNPIIYLENYL